MMIAVIDYGMGNLRSVQKAFEFLGFAAEIVTEPEATSRASHLVLPGDAAFGDAMRKLQRAGWVERLRAEVEAGKPFLGICAGLQLMFGESEEMGRHEGLGLLPGRVMRFPTGQRVPQIGWNQIAIERPCDLLDGVPDGSFFYFVHSYYVVADDPAHRIAGTEYGISYTSIAGRGRVFGVQFHPEKSQERGLRLLANFARME
jgi:glutamine amidotransferase